MEAVNTTAMKSISVLSEMVHQLNLAKDRFEDGFVSRVEKSNSNKEVSSVEKERLICIGRLMKVICLIDHDCLRDVRDYTNVNVVTNNDGVVSVSLSLRNGELEVDWSGKSLKVSYRYKEKTATIYCRRH